MEWDSPSKTKCHLNRGTVDPTMLDTAFGGVIFLESPEIHMFSFLVKSVRSLYQKNLNIRAGVRVRGRGGV